MMGPHYKASAGLPALLIIHLHGELHEINLGKVKAYKPEEFSELAVHGRLCRHACRTVLKLSNCGKFT